MNLLRWAQEQLRTVETNGHHVKKVKLASVDGGMVWETWEAPFPEPDEFVREATVLLDELKQEWPARKVQVLFIAEDETGGVKSQCPYSVQGANKAASPAFFNSESRALAESMDAQARTMQRILDTANGQLSAMSEQNKQLIQYNAELLEHIRLERENRALNQKNDSEATDQLKKQVADALPLLVEVLVSKVQGKPTAGLIEAAKVGAAALQANGKAVAAAAANGATEG